MLRFFLSLCHLRSSDLISFDFILPTVFPPYLSSALSYFCDFNIYIYFFFQFPLSIFLGLSVFFISATLALVSRSLFLASCLGELIVLTDGVRDGGGGRRTGGAMTAFKIRVLGD